MAKTSNAVLDVARWRLRYPSQDRIVCRPGPLSFLLGLFITGLMAGGIVWLVQSFGPVPWLGWNGASVADNLLRNSYTVGVGLMGFVGVLAPLSRLWVQVVVSRDERGNVVLSRKGMLFPSRWSWPAAGTSPIAPAALETRPWRNPYTYYRWVVQTHGEGAPGEPSVYVCFILASQNQRPSSGARPPERVADFARALSGLTGAPCDEAGVIERGHVPGAGAVRIRRRAGVPQTTGTVKRQVFRSLDEMPPELRQRAAQLLHDAKARGEDTAKEESITYRDRHGRVHRFASVDKMPPDIRAKYEAYRQGQQG